MMYQSLRLPHCTRESSRSLVEASPWTSQVMVTGSPGYTAVGDAENRTILGPAGVDGAWTVGWEVADTARVGVGTAEAGPALGVAVKPAAGAVGMEGDGTTVEDGRAPGGVARVGSCGAGLVADDVAAREATAG